MIEAVVFDLDDVLIDSERVWSDSQEQLVRESGGTWRPEATRTMMGMSSTEWSRYLHDALGVKMSPEAISDAVVERVMAIYRERLPLLPGAREAVSSLASRWPLGLASSSNRPVIELVLDLADFRRFFAATVTSEEVRHGKPAPDVYLEATSRLNVEPLRCVAVEDSTNGLRSAEAAEMTTIAIPNRHFPPAEEALGQAALVIDSLEQLRPALLDRLTLARS
jgi:HAD superfamily hydrolase (TIGR01509 family)